MLGLVFRRKFAGLTLACAMLALTAPAGAQRPDGPPPHADPHAQSAPGQAGDRGRPDAPPGQEERAEHAPAAAAPADDPPPAAEPPAPTAAQPEPASERARVQIRSVTAPLPPAAPTEEPPAADDPPAARRERPSEPPAALRPEGRDDARAERTAAPVGRAILADAAAPAPSQVQPAEASADDERAAPVPPPQPLPAQVVPEPVRRIIEVVPGAVWTALAILALLTVALAASSWVTAMRARQLRRQRQALLQEVGLLQAALLPRVPDDIPASVAYRPVDGATAGGDFYDVFTVPTGLTGVVLGDVSGHGREALSRTTFIRYTLRAYLEAGLEPRDVVKVGSAALAEHLDGGFATVVVALHDPATGRFTYATAGHPPPLVVGGPEAFEPVIACSAPPLGVGAHTGFRQTTFTLPAGARACLYTDGVVEARVGGRLFGLARLERMLAELPPGADADSLLDAVDTCADEVTDDMAMCLVPGGATAPATGPRVEEIEVDEREVGDSLEHFLRACGVALADVPGILREAGEAARREGFATVRVRTGDFRPGVDVVPGNVVPLAERRRSVRGL